MRNRLLFIVCFLAFGYLFFSRSSPSIKANRTTPASTAMSAIVETSTAKSSITNAPSHFNKPLGTNGHEKIEPSHPTITPSSTDIEKIASRSIWFADLPESDRKWVAAETMAAIERGQIKSEDSFEYADQLSSVRLFAVRERTQPYMKAPEVTHEN